MCVARYRTKTDSDRQRCFLTILTRYSAIYFWCLLIILETLLLSHVNNTVVVWAAQPVVCWSWFFFYKLRYAVIGSIDLYCRRETLETAVKIHRGLNAELLYIIDCGVELTRTRNVVLLIICTSQLLPTHKFSLSIYTVNQCTVRSLSCGISACVSWLCCVSCVILYYYAPVPIGRRH